MGWKSPSRRLGSSVLLAVAFTYICTMFSTLFFRAPSVPMVGRMLKILFGFRDGPVPPTPWILWGFWLFFAVFALVEFSQEYLDLNGAGPSLALGAARGRPGAVGRDRHPDRREQQRPVYLLPVLIRTGRRDSTCRAGTGASSPSFPRPGPARCARSPGPSTAGIPSPGSPAPGPRGRRPAPSRWKRGIGCGVPCADREARTFRACGMRANSRGLR